jgi:hypothetical protein
VLQTDRKTEAARQTPQDREQTRRRQSPEKQNEASQALEAILNGVSWERLPAEGMLALSHRMGNDALLSVLSLRETGPETQRSSLPGGPCPTEPMDFGPGEAATESAPDFGAFTSMGDAAPMAL